MNRKWLSAVAVLGLVGCALSTQGPESSSSSDAVDASLPPSAVGPNGGMTGVRAQLTHGRVTDSTTLRVVGGPDVADYRVQVQRMNAQVKPATPSIGWKVATGSAVHATPATYSSWALSNATDLMGFAVNGSGANPGITGTAQVHAGWNAAATTAKLFVLTNLYANAQPDLLGYVTPSTATDTFELSGVTFSLDGKQVYALSAQGRLYCYTVPTTLGSAMAACGAGWPYAAGNAVTWSSPYPTYTSGSNAVTTLYFGDDGGKLHCVNGTTGASCWGASIGGVLAAPGNNVSALGPPTVQTYGANLLIFVGDDFGHLFEVHDTGVAPIANAGVSFQRACGAGDANGNCATIPWAARGAPTLDITGNRVYYASGGNLFSYPMTIPLDANSVLTKQLVSFVPNAPIEGSPVLDSTDGWAYLAFHNTLYKTQYPFDGVPPAVTTDKVWSTALVDTAGATHDNFPRGFPLPYTTYSSVYVGTGTNSGTTGVLERYGCQGSGVAPVLQSVTKGTLAPNGAVIESGAILDWMNGSLYFGFDNNAVPTAPPWTSSNGGGVVQYPSTTTDQDGNWGCPGSLAVAPTLACGSPGCAAGCTVATDCAAFVGVNNVATEQCSSGSCEVATCAANYSDCDGLNANGCETDVQTDINNCGSTSPQPKGAGCGNVCANTNETATCIAGACGGTCNPGWAHCPSGPAGCSSGITCGSCCTGLGGPGACGYATTCSTAGACTASTIHACAYTSEDNGIPAGDVTPQVGGVAGCPGGSVIQSVTFASYGTPSGSCGSFTASPTCDDNVGSTCNGTPANCNKNEMQIALDACYGQTSCTIYASNTNVQPDGLKLGDPCVNIKKDFALQVECGCPCASAADCGGAPNNECIAGVCMVIDAQACTKGNNQCESQNCTGGTCAAPTTCTVGGGAAPCNDLSRCGKNADCGSQNCATTTTATCQAPTSCTVAPGGASGAPCETGSACGAGSDCLSTVCTAHACATSANGVACKVNADCTSTFCDSTTKLCDANSCSDGVKDGTETGVDCGGATCDGAGKTCGTGIACLVNADCTTTFCDSTTKLCDANSCSDGIKDGTETAIDCGGATCDGLGDTCNDGLTCAVPADCKSAARCTATKCACEDGAKDNGETGTDCGGATCRGLGFLCGTGGGCAVPGDCQSGVCTGAICQAPTCTDGVKNGNETGVDCGGALCDGSGHKCNDGIACAVVADCKSAICNSLVCACGDGATDNGETALDCGGATCDGLGHRCNDGLTCAAPADCVSSTRCSASKCACEDGVNDNGETGVDCGGATCRGLGLLCGAGVACLVNADCTSTFCDSTTKRCDTTSCNDGVKDGTETGIDCGGATCDGLGFKCNDGVACAAAADCKSADCNALVCACGDGITDNGETATDCGGATCDGLGHRCDDGLTCAAAADCVSSTRCTGSKCACEDGVKDNGETDIDCGGATCDAIPVKCSFGKGCSSGADCVTGSCPAGTCGKALNGGGCNVSSDCATAGSICLGNICKAQDTVTCNGNGAAACMSNNCVANVCRNPGNSGTGNCSSGGGVSPCNDTSRCGANADCGSNNCDIITTATCQPPSTCSVGGGSIPCEFGSACGAGTDCVSGTCTTHACAKSANGTACKATIDCNAQNFCITPALVCEGIDTVTPCSGNAACESQHCSGGGGGTCNAPSACLVGGGAAPCQDGSWCGTNGDCLSGNCDTATTAKCLAPATCSVGGGSPPCPIDSACGANADCSSGFCTNGLCTDQCHNKITDNGEASTDCGGTSPCKACTGTNVGGVAANCASNRAGGGGGGNSCRNCTNASCLGATAPYTICGASNVCEANLP